MLAGRPSRVEYRRMDSTQPLVFISYATPDRDAVNIYADALERAGVDVWMDHRRLIAGQNWDDEIRRALGKAAIVVVFMSDNSVDRRGYAQREVRLALKQAEEKLGRDIYLIPVLLTELQEYPEAVKHLHMVKVWEGNPEGQILASISHQIDALGGRVQATQAESGVRWTERIIKESWDGVPGYDIDYNVFLLSSPEIPNIEDITTIIRGELAEAAAEMRLVKFDQNPEHYTFGQKRFLRTNLFESHCRQPVIVEQTLSMSYATHTYGAGAAHGNVGFSTFVFTLDPVTRIAELGAIFADREAALPAIQALIRPRLCDDLARDCGGDPADYQEWVDSGTADWKDLNAFTFSEHGLELLFGGYAVAAYACGPRFVTLANTEIHHLLRKEIAAALGWEHLRWRDAFAPDAESA